MLVSAKEMLNKAREGKYAVGQFNINNLEWTKAILLTAQELNSPVILGVSEGAGKYMTGYHAVVGMVNGMLQDLNITVPVALHLDHGSYEGAFKTIEAGFSSVMFDGSHYPIAENIEKTKEIVRVAHEKGISVEAEVGAIGGEEDGVVDPLSLLRAFRAALPRVGVDYRQTLVFDVQPHAGGYRVTTKEGTFDCQKLVLAAGLSNRRFVQFAMPTLPVYADKGQVLLVERMPFVMPIPVLGVTQTFGGTTIIGFRHEKAGHHTQVVPSAVASEGKWAIRVWPELGKKRLIRAWAGLRVMPDDSMAIYSRLPGHPNVTLVNTHSAVTMAAAHTRLLPDFILGGELPETAQGMTLKRFGYSC